ncbi:similar to Saccharomyces cerevisiae YDR041W RSM10 Mitochondrial ribosomal protein of the small subunit, has similarity to E. coli S10 ribosomal protein [Maudiozyma saulgeensis]|uniref:Small ribosomal subunit protein uS10m n=1 Tax=Maudiozyma saulgeensis TaxID=1789683 RepID=A0A1X7R4C4_9SACH|nr:similar to Saccharomyces cerevisiae YDR041W RSM10 Mitochondrial ribosomal protein of the small subunit, has similarity to E. coli S10 ribosomal protein [Kazachstania saulgeensis]
MLSNISHGSIRVLPSVLNSSLLKTIRLQSTIAHDITNDIKQDIPKNNVYTNSPIDEIEKKPIVKSLEAIYQAPMRIPIEHGHLIADIQLRSYEHQNLDFFINFIQRVGFYLGIPLTGPKPLPTRRERWTVIRSPFVHAKSKENFERHTHKRLLRVWDTNDEILELFVSYIKKHAMTGIGMKCNVYKREPITIDFDKNEGLPSTLTLDSTSIDNDLVNAKVLELLNSPEFKK